MTIPEPIRVRGGELNADELEAIPASPGIYHIIPQSGESHISWSVSLRRRTERLLRSFGASIEWVECWPTASKLDTSLLLYVVTRRAFPNDYRARLRLRSPWFLEFSHIGEFAQLAISNRIHDVSPCVLGPFGSRDLAQALQEKVLALFQLRRCPGTLTPTPDHPGCIYGEMNQCLRPCQCAVTADEYETEVHRVEEFLGTPPRKLVAGLSLARQQASENLDFEQAAQLHKRLEKVKAALALRDDAVADVHSFRGVVVARAYAERSCYLRPMWDGCWQAPIVISFPEGGASRSLDADLRERLEAIAAAPLRTGDVLDNFALFQRWYASSWRDGEWFPFAVPGGFDYPRLVRRISKLVNITSVNPAEPA